MQKDLAGMEHGQNPVSLESQQLLPQVT